MKIEKYKKCANGKYKVFFDNCECFDYYEDVILKYNFLISKNIDDETLKEADFYNQECEVYHVALKNLRTRNKSIFEIKNYLIKKEYPQDMIDTAVKKLCEQGYLNDCSYAKSYVSYSICATSKGPNRIKKELLDKKISSEEVSSSLMQFDIDMQKERIGKIINKMIKSNRSRSGGALKKKIISSLIQLGYDLDIINQVINDFSFETDKKILEKEYNKLYKKYKDKYSGEYLERFIRQKLISKGLIDIYE